MNPKIYIFVSLLFILLVGCTQGTTGTSIPNEATLSTGYPIISTAYPVSENPISNGYPSIEIDESSIKKPKEVTPFTFDKPLNQGDTEISGTGPKNIPIIIVDITMNGSVIGNTTVDKNGRFSLTVPALEASHRLGIRIYSPDGIAYNGLDYSGEGFQGSEPKSVPNVGYFFDTVLVR
jgi:hypothetical protein